MADVIINATPVGMHPNVDDTPLPPAAFSRPGMVVFDTIYHPENTMMLKLARERGCQAVTGVDMFLRQAALQFKLYTGQDAAGGRDARRPSNASSGRSATNDERPRLPPCRAGPGPGAGRLSRDRQVDRRADPGRPTGPAVPRLPISRSRRASGRSIGAIFAE